MIRCAILTRGFSGPCSGPVQWAVQWAVQDLNLRPLACHAHISCSPVLSDVQISPNRNTLCPPRFARVCPNFSALLTALLTKCLLQFTQGIIEIDERVMPKSTDFLVEVRTLRLDPDPSATPSATRENPTSRQLKYRALLRPGGVDW